MGRKIDTAILISSEMGGILYESIFWRDGKVWREFFAPSSSTTADHSVQVRNYFDKKFRRGRLDDVAQCGKPELFPDLKEMAFFYEDMN